MGKELKRDLQTDVLVVGAGPAGCMAAMDLARQGINVLVADRSQFPREKVCGDGLLEDSLQILESVGLGSEVQQKAHPIRSILFVAPNGTECELEGNFLTLPRKDLDALLLEEACKAGAQFLGGITVSEPLVQNGVCAGALGLDEEGHEINITARLVLLATGANARIMRVFGVLQNRNHSAIGVRGYFRLTETIDESSMVVVYDKRILPGYGWMFPLGQGIFNVGCGIFLEGRKRMPWTESDGILQAHSTTGPLPTNGGANSAHQSGSYAHRFSRGTRLRARNPRFGGGPWSYISIHWRGDQ